MINLINHHVLKDGFQNTCPQKLKPSETTVTLESVSKWQRKMEFELCKRKIFFKIPFFVYIILSSTYPTA